MGEQPVILSDNQIKWIKIVLGERLSSVSEDVGDEVYSSDELSQIIEEILVLKSIISVLK